MSVFALCLDTQRPYQHNAFYKKKGKNFKRVVKAWPSLYLPSSSAHTKLDPAQDIDTGDTDKPPEAAKADRLLGGCPHASATGVSRVADSINTRRVVRTATMGTAGELLSNPPR